MSYFTGPDPGIGIDLTSNVCTGSWQPVFCEWWLISALVHIGGAIG